MGSFGVARLYVRRDNAWYGRFRKLRVLLDGNEVGRLACGETQVFDLAPGPHELTVQMDWVKSQPLRFTCKPGEEVAAECASPGLSFSWRELLSFDLWERASRPFQLSLTTRDHNWKVKR